MAVRPNCEPNPTSTVHPGLDLRMAIATKGENDGREIVIT
jgi:hypothetical protein